jgi:hypothetical protein
VGGQMEGGFGQALPEMAVVVGGAGGGRSCDVLNCIRYFSMTF